VWYERQYARSRIRECESVAQLGIEVTDAPEVVFEFPEDKPRHLIGWAVRSPELPVELLPLGQAPA
jgi:hypothetical protein